MINSEHPGTPSSHGRYASFHARAVASLAPKGNSVPSASRGYWTLSVSRPTPTPPHGRDTKGSASVIRGGPFFLKKPNCDSDNPAGRERVPIDRHLGWWRCSIGTHWPRQAKRSLAHWPYIEISPLLPSAFTCLLIAIGSSTMGESSEAAKARAEAMFRITAAGETRPAGMSEYMARQQAELDKTSRLRALRLAREQPKK